MSRNVYHLIALVSAICILWSDTSVSALEPKPGEPVNGLQAELLLDHVVFKVGEPIPVSIELRNVGDQPLAVFKGLIPVYNSYGEALFVLETLDGRSISITHPEDDRPAPLTEDFARLQPGQVVKVQTELRPTDWTWGMEPGRYALRVQVNVHANAAYDGTHMRPVEQVWTDSVVSNAVTIEVDNP